MTEEYPIWWGEAPRIIDTFMESYDFSGKTIVPFCTSGGSGVGSSATNLEALTDGTTWFSGTRLNGGSSREQIVDWVNGLVLVGNRGMLRLLFGSVEDSVMDACVAYLKISAYSYPALAIYNSGAAVYRSLGKTNVTMYISVLSNMINVAGNAIGVFVLHAGVAGVAWPSLIARTFSAAAITVLCFRKKNEVVYAARWIFKWETDCLKRIWKVAVPNGVENGIFQLVKVALSSIVALFGTYQIAANGVAQSIWSLAALAGVAMGPAFITVVGQCMVRAEKSA